MVVVGAYVGYYTDVVVVDASIVVDANVVVDVDAALAAIALDDDALLEIVVGRVSSCDG